MIRKKLVWFTIELMVLCSFSTCPQAEEVCEGKYRNGETPTTKELAILLKDHTEWLETYTNMRENTLWIDVNFRDDTKKANLCNANLTSADFQSTRMRGADLHGANLQGANMQFADFINADLHGANMSHANLRNAFFVDADLRDVDLTHADLSYTALHDSKMSGANLAGVRFAMNGMKLAGHPVKLPDMELLSQARNLSQIQINDSLQTTTEFIKLREEFKKYGKRDQERAITAALKRMEARKTNFLERWFVFFAFDLTTEYGASPGRSLRILGFMIFVFSFPYGFALTRKEGSGIWKIWPKERILKNPEYDQPIRLNLNIYDFKLILTALYFSLLSAASIGWRELNFGNWITRIQPNEYTLGATGWVRSMSGFQSLISVYLIALWVLTYFGRPFE